MARRRARRRARRPKRGFATWSVGKKVAAILGGTFVTVAAAGVVLLASKLGKIETKTLDTKALEINEEVEHQTGYLNVALFGVDSREAALGKGTRSDSIMVASLNLETKEVKICSVYRDTLLQQKDGSYNKANAAYSFEGVEGAVALLNKNLDLDIQHYVTVNFNALIDVIDALGGIELELTDEEVFWTNGYCNETSKVTGHKFENLTGSGLMTLDGVQATSFCRIRYTAGDDYKRTERQRMVLEQIVKKVQNANLSTINKIIDDVFPEIGTNFTLTEILTYAKDATKYTLGETAGFPFDKGTDTLSGIGSTVIPMTLESNVIQMHQFLFGEDGYTPSSTVKEISAGVAKKAGDVKKDEEETDSGNSSSNTNKTNNNTNKNNNTQNKGNPNNSGKNNGSGGSGDKNNSGGGTTPTPPDNGGNGESPTPTPPDGGGSGGDGGSGGGGNQDGGSSGGGETTTP